MHILSITSGKGGTGKSLVTANLGIALASKGARVAIFDADLQLANLDVVFGVRSAFNLQHVVSGEKQLDEILTTAPGGVKLITGGSAVPTLLSAGPKRLAIFMSQIDALSHDFDFLLFDTGAGLDNRVATFCRFANETILVATPDPTSITDAYATVKFLHKRAPGVPISTVINEVTNEEEAKRVHKVLQETSHTFLQRELPLLGWVRYDREAGQSIRKRKPLMLSAPQCPAAADIERLANRFGALIGEEMPRRRVA